MTQGTRFRFFWGSSFFPCLLYPASFTRFAELSPLWPCPSSSNHLRQTSTTTLLNESGSGCPSKWDPASLADASGLLICIGHLGAINIYRAVKRLPHFGLGTWRVLKLLKGEHDWIKGQTSESFDLIGGLTNPMNRSRYKGIRELPSRSMEKSQIFKLFIL